MPFCAHATNTRGGGLTPTKRQLLPEEAVQESTTCAVPMPTRGPGRPDSATLSAVVDIFQQAPFPLLGRFRALAQVVLYPPYTF